jgi:hypothetical protein
MSEKTVPLKKGVNPLDLIGRKQSDNIPFPAPQIKMLDGNLSSKERRQVVMKLITYMKTT